MYAAKTRALYAAVFLAAVIVRLGVVFALPVEPLKPDYMEYRELARGLRERGRYDFGSEWQRDAELARSPWRYLYEERGAFLRPPGYPAAIALLDASVGGDLRRHQIALALLDGVTAVLLCLTASHLFGTTAGVVASALYVLNPGYCYVIARVGREPFLVFSLALGMFLSFRACRVPSLRAGVSAGLAFGLGGYFKQTLLAAGGLIGLGLAALSFWRRAELRRPGLALLVAVLLCPIPWTLRNVLEHRAAVGFSNVSGLAVWLGLVDSHWLDQQSEALQRELDPWSAPHAVDANRRLVRQVVAFAQEQPLAVLRNAGLNALAFASPVPLRVWREGSVSLRDVASLLFYGPLLAFGLLGLWRFREREEAQLSAFVLLGVWALHSLTVSWPRYRLPFDVFLIVFAAGWLDALVRRWQSARER